MIRRPSSLKCEQALFSARWPDGFLCPECGHTGYCEIKPRKLHQCHQRTSLTSGTIFDHNKLDLTIWFLAMYLITQSKAGISARALRRHLGIGYNSAWRLKHKLMQVMMERDNRRALGGYIQLDNA